MLAPFDPALAPHHYRISQAAPETGFSVYSAGDTALLENADQLLFHLDKDLTITLQLQRPDLLFLHAAVVAWKGRAAVVSAPSGTGKSTFTLALLEEGFDYLSDELAPIDLERGMVHPYPHALCLKTPPPPPYRLPAATFDAGSRLHVPAASLGVVVHQEPVPLAALIFIRRHGAAPTSAQRLGAATAAAHLMSNALNPLAHAGAGLDAAIALAGAVPGFELDSTDLRAACREVKAILEQMP